MIKVSNINTKISPFFSDIIQILAIQVVFQLVFSLLIEYEIFEKVIEIFQYVQISTYFFIFLIVLFSLKYSVANKILIILYLIEFFILAINPIIYFFNQTYFNLYLISNSSLLLLTTLYLFFYSISPKLNKSTKHIVYALIVTIGITLLTYYDTQIFIDYNTMQRENYLIVINDLFFNNYSIFLINLSFLIFVWIIYSQGQYILSEYLPSITALHTLTILNEVYQLYNYNHLIENIINSLVFNFIINSGFIIIWLARLNYISKPESKKNEKYVLNYDLLKGYVDKNSDGLWKFLLVKIGKKNLFVGSTILFIIIIIPLSFLGEIDIFNRVNIILLFLFIFLMIVYAIIYTQKRWFTYIGFLFKPPKK